MRKYAGQEEQTLRVALAVGLEGGAFELPECHLVGVVPSPARPVVAASLAGRRAPSTYAASRSGAVETAPWSCPDRSHVEGLGVRSRRGGSALRPVLSPVTQPRCVAATLS